MDIDDIVGELEKLEPLRQKIKAQAMIYQKDMKDGAAKVLGLNAEDLYDLPYVEWDVIRAKYFEYLKKMDEENTKMRASLQERELEPGNWREFGDFSWHEQPEDADNWFIFYTSSRDTDDAAELANAESWEEILQSYTEGDDPDVISQRHSHWASGYIDGYAVRVVGADGEPTEAAEEVENTFGRLEDYPVLDEEKWSRIETEQSLEYIDVLTTSSWLNDDAPSDWVDGVYRWFSENNPEALESTGPGEFDMEESDIRAALLDLGWMDTDELSPEEEEADELRQYRRSREAGTRAGQTELPFESKKMNERYTNDMGEDLTSEQYFIQEVVPILRRQISRVVSTGGFSLRGRGRTNKKKGTIEWLWDRRNISGELIIGGSWLTVSDWVYDIYLKSPYVAGGGALQLHDELSTEPERAAKDILADVDDLMDALRSHIDDEGLSESKLNERDERESLDPEELGSRDAYADGERAARVDSWLVNSLNGEEYATAYQEGGVDGLYDSVREWFETDHFNILYRHPAVSGSVQEYNFDEDEKFEYLTSYDEGFADGFVNIVIGYIESGVDWNEIVSVEDVGESRLNETGEADQDYDQEMFDKIASEIEKVGYEVSHREFDKYQGVYLDISKGDYSERFWIHEYYVSGKKKPSGAKYSDATLYDEEGNPVSSDRGDYFMSDPDTVVGQLLVLTTMDGEDTEIENPVVADLPDLGDVERSFQYEGEPNEHFEFIPDSVTDEEDMFTLPVVISGETGEVDASVLVEYLNGMMGESKLREQDEDDYDEDDYAYDHDDRWFKVVDYEKGFKAGYIDGKEGARSGLVVPALDRPDDDETDTDAGYYDGYNKGFEEVKDEMSERAEEEVYWYVVDRSTGRAIPDTERTGIPTGKQIEDILFSDWPSKRKGVEVVHTGPSFEAGVGEVTTHFLDSETGKLRTSTAPSFHEIPERLNEQEGETETDGARTFNSDDKGLYVDGALGVDHALRKLSAMIEIWDPALSEELMDEVSSEQKEIYYPETVDELTDDATDVLQDHTDEGLVWIWEAGDLILTTEEEARSGEEAERAKDVEDE